LNQVQPTKRDGLPIPFKHLRSSFFCFAGPLHDKDDRHYHKGNGIGGMGIDVDPKESDTARIDQDKCKAEENKPLDPAGLCDPIPLNEN
jgi:hypothetical protein